METHSPKSALVIGASFAGISTAFWMSRLGYAVTLVEIGKGIKRGGTPVDIRGGTVDIVKKMGLFDKVWAGRLPARPMTFRNRNGEITVQSPAQSVEAQGTSGECEIERDVLLDILFNAIQPRVEILFGESVDAITDNEDSAAVRFKSGRQRSFSIVFGADGVHSATRRMQFGPEANYAYFMHHYFGLSVVDKLLIDAETSQIWNVPGKSMMLNAYASKTDVAFTFYADDEIPYDHRDLPQQKRLVATAFAGEDWSRDMMRELANAPNFYFDKFCQIRMASWTKGRVALVGDAGYCASPAAGMGGSLAIVGASHIGDAFAKHPDDFQSAFAEYDRSLRPFVDEVQANAISEGLEMFAPRTEEAIQQRNAALAG